MLPFGTKVVGVAIVGVAIVGVAAVDDGVMICTAISVAAVAIIRAKRVSNLQLGLAI